jgi:hypothetical protein
VIRALTGVLLVLSAQGASAQQIKAHMEACTRWGQAGGEFGTHNSCDSPVTIQFMALGDQQVIERDVPPGAWFGTGASGAWMFTACPVGYVPSVRFALENKDVILVSLYNCHRARPDA